LRERCATAQKVPAGDEEVAGISNLPAGTVSIFLSVIFLSVLPIPANSFLCVFAPWRDPSVVILPFTHAPAGCMLLSGKEWEPWIWRASD
jgi:hypothetical protein